MKRPLLNKDLTKDCEFLLELRNGPKAIVKPVNFTINPRSIQNVNMVRS